MSLIRDDDDLISSLPDAVICRILSFLLTKQVVATSILSKRWMHLWRSVPVIDLTNENGKIILFDDHETLLNFTVFMYSILPNLDSIKSFCIYVGYDNSSLEFIGSLHVINWINNVVQHRVEKMYLAICTVFYDVQLPVSVLTCRTLVVLNVSGFNVKGFTSVILPSLKVLHIEDSIFLNDRDFRLLLAGCPNLEDLSTFNLGFEGFLTYQDSESLDLRKLTKALMPLTDCYFPLKALHNVEELHIELNEVYQSFDEILTFHNLTELTLHSINSNWDLLVQVLNHCPNLQNLELDEGTFDGLRDYVPEVWVDPEFVPQCLSLQLKTCKYQNFLGQQGELMSARYILKNAKVLQTMEIFSLKIDQELLSCPRASPTCELIFHEKLH